MKRLALILLAATSLSIGASFLVQQNVKALSGSDFNPGKIIDDSVFYNSDSMTVNQIAQFINSKMPGTCDINGTGPAVGWDSSVSKAVFAERKRNGSHGQVQDSGFHAPPYICLKEYKANTPQIASASGYCEAIPAATNQTAAQMIYSVAKACGINPQVFIVLLEKEQSLITDSWPLNRQYLSATGFACPDTADCDPAYRGLFQQIYNAAKQFKIYQALPNDYNYRSGRTQTVYYNPGPCKVEDSSGKCVEYYVRSGLDKTKRDIGYCGSTQLYIENQATAALYIYTPYQPNRAALNNLTGTGDLCSAYGNRNFWRLFNDWFGSTMGLVYNGIDYSSVFNVDYYLNRYPDLKAALNQSNAFTHFVRNGMSEGRQAAEDFNVVTYRNRYPDLRWSYETDLGKYYSHYALYGKKEGRKGDGTMVLAPVTTYNGINYSKVYDYEYYVSNNADIANSYNNKSRANDTATLKHFALYGVKEGRASSGGFNVNSYKNNNSDLRMAYGNDTEKYYLHYIKWGQSEGRVATGSNISGTTTFGGTNYSLVYNFQNYIQKNGDIFAAFGLNDIASIQHFINNGMKEGRLASDKFNVNTYKNSNADIKAAYGNDTEKYYLHYMKWGHVEGRKAI